MHRQVLFLCLRQVKHVVDLIISDTFSHNNIYKLFKTEYNSTYTLMVIELLAMQWILVSDHLCKNLTP